MDAWDPQFLERSSMLAPLRAAAVELCGDRWPSVATMQNAVDRAGVHTASGLALRLTSPARQDAGGAYELRVYEQGALEVRECNWHDLFNLLVWLTFPRTKAALNARHCAAFVAHLDGGRGPVRDALTLFDESGVVVVSIDAALLQLTEDFQWRTLFLTRRADAVRDMRFVLFGHALYEKVLAPYKGMTGRGLLFPVPDTFMELPFPEQLTQLDMLLAARIADPHELQCTGALAPVPVLGVPGWCADNTDATYYEDVHTFRPGRRGARA